MRNRYFKIFWICTLIITCSISFGQSQITVNTNNVWTSGIDTKMGINLNAGFDSDVNRAFGSRSLVDGLKDLGVKHLRYPGGEKSNYYSWAASPYTSASTQYWVSGSWYAQVAQNSMNFDQFMTICNQVGATPHINVAYNPTAGLGASLAAEWVRYANITKNYGIKYWEIGNEMWHSNKGNLTGSQLTAIAHQYVNAMKAVDPTIKIGMSGNLSDKSMLDFYTISNYSNYGGSYNSYITGSWVGLSDVNSNSDKQIVVSEYNAANFSSDYDDMTNNAMHGLITFDMTGQLLLNGKSEYACFWNTRWYDDGNGSAGTKWDALNAWNWPTPAGRTMSLWGTFAHDKLVETQYTNGPLVAYSSYDSSNGDLTVFVVNKSGSARNINITITSSQTYNQNAQVWRYGSTGPYDTNPTYGNVGTVTVTNNRISNYSLPTTSVTAIILKGNGGGSTGSTYKIQNRANNLFIDGAGASVNGSNCLQWSSSNSTNQQWRIETIGAYVKIKNVTSGLYLDGEGATTNGANCIQWSNGASYNQQWSQEVNGSYLMFKNRATGLYLDNIARATSGSILGQWSYSGSNNQQWSLTQLNSAKIDQSVKSVLANSKNELGFQFYPNPVKDYISFNISGSESIDVSFIDLEGRVVLSSRINSYLKLDISKLQNGIYILNIKSSKGDFFEKVVVSK